MKNWDAFAHAVGCTSVRSGPRHGCRRPAPTFLQRLESRRGTALVFVALTMGTPP